VPSTRTRARYTRTLRCLPLAGCCALPALLPLHLSTLLYARSLPLTSLVPFYVAFAALSYQFSVAVFCFACAVHGDVMLLLTGITVRLYTRHYAPRAPRSLLHRAALPLLTHVLYLQRTSITLLAPGMGEKPPMPSTILRIPTWADGSVPCRTCLFKCLLPS